uniref:AB hydrolase-1 domain-containing protein n=1 Tax=Tetraselmis chuii TaxID=63592 RepID=A0A7S1XB42_9CHLO|mmetsp:Transcript_8986/g.16181  ORF Transcript_8986/g.16181 Transcript_8986/m.16181 type:complete len:385 (+) Transcript_8986:91-1245(+)
MMRPATVSATVCAGSYTGRVGAASTHESLAPIVTARCRHRRAAAHSVSLGVKCHVFPPKRRDSIPRRLAPPLAASLTSTYEDAEREVQSGVFEGFWSWRGHRVRYVRSGTEGPQMLLVHGFGGNADHWRKNVGYLGQFGQVWAIDLLGYGYSSKPKPDPENPNQVYNFEVWAEQLNDFQEDKFGGAPSFLISNSVGGVACLQAAVNRSDLVQGVQLLDVSLRMLHTSKQPPLARPFIAYFQKLLRTTSLGRSFFAQVAQHATVKKILKEAYFDPSAVTDELVDCILKPGLEPGAVDVFLDFISYSGGPLAEDLLPKLTCPVSILWGEEDPWEKLEWGRKFESYDAVEEFVPLPGVGHCPMDEAPDTVNPLIKRFVMRHAAEETV